jgi:hypothetical protein
LFYLRLQPMDLGFASHLQLLPPKKKPRIGKTRVLKIIT